LTYSITFYFRLSVTLCGKIISILQTTGTCGTLSRILGFSRLIGLHFSSTVNFLLSSRAVIQYYIVRSVCCNSSAQSTGTWVSRRRGRSGCLGIRSGSL